MAVHLVVQNIHTVVPWLLRAWIAQQGFGTASLSSNKSTSFTAGKESALECEMTVSVIATYKPVFRSDEHGIGSLVPVSGCLLVSAAEL